MELEPERKSERKSNRKPQIRRLRPLFGLAIAKGRKPRVPLAITEWRAQLLTDLGGEQDLSAQESCLVELAVRYRLYLDYVDNYILNLPEGIVIKRRKSIMPVVMQRSQLSTALERCLSTLGLKRRMKPVEDIRDIIARKDQEDLDHSGHDQDGRSAEPAEHADRNDRADRTTKERPDEHIDNDSRP